MDFPNARARDGENDRPWKFESSVSAQTLSATLFLGGSIFAFCRARYAISHPGTENLTVITILNYVSGLAASISVYLFLLWRATEVVVEPAAKFVKIGRRNFFGKQDETIPFKDILGIVVKTQRVMPGRNMISGEAFAYTQFVLYFQLKNRDLLNTGFFTRDFAKISQLQSRLEKSIGCSFAKHEPNRSSKLSAIAAAVIAIGTYLLYYRIQIGSFCPAMWLGIVPVVFILSVFIFARSILERFF